MKPTEIILEPNLRKLCNDFNQANMPNFIKPFVRSHGRKYYIIPQTAVELKEAHCPCCHETTTAFAVQIEDLPDQPGKFITAFQCDSCNMHAITAHPKHDKFQLQPE